MTSILFLGTPSFAVPILEELHKNFQIIGVITQPDRPVGRKLALAPPPVKAKAIELGLKVYQPEKASDIPALVPSSFDFLVTAAYGEYLPTKVLKMAKKDALNVHPSLLPEYRGATPMQSAILDGTKNTTGVSIIRMIKEMDAGPIFAQEKTVIYPDMKYPELEVDCAKLGADLITQVIKNYQSITPADQDNRQASYCKKIDKKDGLINWTEESAYEIYNKLRAFTPWPGVYTSFKQQKLSLLEFSTHHLDSEQAPGTVTKDQDHILIQCSLGSIHVKSVQLAGKKPMDIKSFLNGQPDFLGSILPS